MNITTTTKVKSVLTVIFLVFIVHANAQNFFRRTVGGTILDWANSVIQTSDSGYAILGSTKNFGSGMEDIYLVKMLANGDTAWTKTYGGSANDEEGAGVVQTPDGGYAIAGTTSSFGQGLSDIFLFKTDANGALQWGKSYGGSNVEFCHNVQLCSDGGFVITGYTSTFGLGGNDVYVIRTNANGDTLWSRTFGTPDHNEAWAITQTSDGGFIITGNTLITGSQKLFVIKTDAAGNILWSKGYDNGSDSGNGISVIQTSDSGYCIAGTCVTTGTILKDIYLVKTDVNGDTLWSRTFDGGGNEECNSIEQTTDGGYILTGYTNSFSLGDDLFIIKTNDSGVISWAKVIGGVSNARDEGRSVIQAIDGGYMVAGFTQTFGVGTDMFIVKTDTGGYSGCTQPNVSFGESSAPATTVSLTLTSLTGMAIVNTISLIEGSAMGIIHAPCIPVGVNDLSPINNTIAIYPNPVSENSIVYLNGDFNAKPVQLIITDEQGRTVKEYNYSTDAFQFSTAGISAGIYFYQVLSGEKSSIAYGKLVIE